MYLGKVVELGSCRDLFMQPLHPYTEALVSAVPIPNRRKKPTRIVLKGDVPSPVNPPQGCYFHPRCKYQARKCSEEMPPLREIAAAHQVACHFPRG
jgi:oligopeptide/dipeptide ABC transporter ATP-binding protein